MTEAASEEGTYFMSTTQFEPVQNAPTLSEIEHAREVVRDAIHVTPMLDPQTIGKQAGADVYLKPENLQRARGVIATSMGNHAQAVAIAARSLGVSATIVMPKQAPLVKVMATRGYGAS